MRILLDTHVFLWWITDAQNLSDNARTIIENTDHELYFSVASAWEIGIKVKTGKLDLPENLEQFITENLVQNHIFVLPIQLSHTLAVYHLPLQHRDPFDRILIAQSQVETMPLLTADPWFGRYDVQTIW